jgi:magnesium chelatase family protein
MSLAVVYSRAEAGVQAPAVSVEVHLANGLPALSIVGLPETAVKESKDRVRAALINSRFEFPARRITINLAPADLPKEGARFDLPIALGILAASGQIPAAALERYEFIGELALTGELRPVRGTLPVALAVRGSGRSLVVPQDNGIEAGLVEGADVRVADHLLAVTAHLNGTAVLTSPRVDQVEAPRRLDGADLAEVRGQRPAKRALEIAAAGGHSLLMIGPPGTGKSMLAARLPGILPGMDDEEGLEAACVRSLAGQALDIGGWRQRPFRSPHHTASAVALVGGGSHPRPGEISLAHRGVLFLDELPEFERRVLEVLREPLETGTITISRAARQAEFPARFQLVAAMNPCPCGHLGDAGGRCHCTAEQVRRYRARVSGPLLDRIDIHVEVPPVPRELLSAPTERDAETSAAVRRRVERARALQLSRQGCVNSALDGEALAKACRLGDDAAALLDQAMDRLRLSARAYHRILRLARTIADLDEAARVETPHVAEAVNYRALDRASY